MPADSFLVTGVSGLLGSNAAFLAAKRGHPVVGLYNNNAVSIAGITVNQLDLTRPQQVKQMIDAVKPKVILHAAANTSIDGCEVNQEIARRDNVTATALLAELAHAKNILLIFISTDAFFEGQDHLFSEHEKPRPLNFYGETKSDAEDAVRQLCPRHIIVRTNFYGWNLRPKHSFSEWIQGRLIQGQKAPLFKDVTFTTILVNTLSEILFDLINLEFEGTIHIAGSDPVTKLTFGQKLCDVFNLDQSLIDPCSVVNASLSARRSSAMALSVEKLQAILPHYDLSLDAGLQQLKQLLMNGYVQELKGSLFEQSMAAALLKTYR